jgi:hypothetical protein
MKTSLTVLFALGVVFASFALVLANPEMLPKHPGYPMGKAVDPVKGQPLANDPGQMNGTGERSLTSAAQFDDPHSQQHLFFGASNQRVLEQPGAGLLPKVQGPAIAIEPPVKEATKVNAAPQ